MQNISRQIPAFVLAILWLASVCTAQQRERTYTYAIEINGELGGYADATVSTVTGDDGRYVLIEQTTIFSASVLGLNVDRQVDTTFHVNPATGRYTYFASHVTGDELDLRSEVTVEGDTAVCTSFLSDEVRRVTLPAHAILPNSMFLTHVIRDLADLAAGPKDYLTLDPNNADHPLQTVTHTKVGAGVLRTPVSPYDCITVETLNRVTGQRMTTWINLVDGLAVKVSLGNGMEITLADPSVRDRIERVDADSLILASAETDISDVSAIASMKVKASMEPVGAWLDVEDLNVPGQRFEGEVIDNRVEGVFEIEHARYDGANAPAYPPDFASDDALAPYLGPGELIESADPVLVARAREIAEGSADSWEAAVRLSRWVADNIGYEIPGGVFSRKVYDLRAGECGGHSVLLAAFCRGVGIPARAVWGCMYTPLGGGSFGQHAWTEIYMGEAGWIPVDSTAHENDFVDSGHIRLGTFGSAEDSSVTAISLGAKSMEVLDYRLTGGGAGDAATSAAGKYVAYVGAYEVPGREEPFRVLVKNGSLGIDIPGRMDVPMKDPDEHGNWVCTLSNLIYCSFPRDEAGNVTGMVFHEIVRLRRKSDPGEIADAVPEGLRPYLGGYFLARVNAEYSIVWDEGRLGLYSPLRGDTRYLEATGEDGRWTTEEGMKEVSFLLDDEGGVISMVIDAGTLFPRLEDTVASTD